MTEQNQTEAQPKKPHLTADDLKNLTAKIKQIARRPIKQPVEKGITNYKAFMNLYEAYSSVQTQKFTVKQFCDVAKEAGFEVSVHQANNFLRRNRNEKKPAPMM